MFGRVSKNAGPCLGTRPNISESHSEISTRVPFCILAWSPQVYVEDEAQLYSREACAHFSPAAWLCAHFSPAAWLCAHEHGRHNPQPTAARERCGRTEVATGRAPLVFVPPVPRAVEVMATTFAFILKSHRRRSPRAHPAARLPGSNISATRSVRPVWCLLPPLPLLSRCRFAGLQQLHPLSADRRVLEYP